MPILELIVCIGLTTSHVFPFSGGNGTETDPYQVTTTEDLVKIGESTTYNRKHFILQDDIDLAGYTFTIAVIAPDRNYRKGYYSSYDGTWFHGTFNGNHHTIKNLTIRGTRQLGLFGRVGGGAQIKNLKLIETDIIGTGDAVAGLVGDNHYGDIVDCAVSGSVVGYEDVGGLVGNNDGMIIRSHSSCFVDGTLATGGLIGSNSSGVVMASYSQGTVIGHSSVGGLVGKGGSLKSCYSISYVHGMKSAGGLVGSSCDISTSYSASVVIGEEFVGGLVGQGGDKIIGGLWDTETSGLLVSSGGVGLTTIEMADPEILGLNGFALDPNWLLTDTYTYPSLAWNVKDGQPIPQPPLNWLDGTGTFEDPYLIDSIEQLIQLSQSSLLWDKHSHLTSDIDMHSDLYIQKEFNRAFIPYFSGSFNGRGHTIANLQIKGSDRLGFVGILAADASVANLNLENTSIEGMGSSVGGIVGYNRSGGIMNCCTKGVIKGGNYVGGLVGYQTDACITGSSCNAVVQGDWFVGGLVGKNGNSHISVSHALGNVGGEKHIGGLVGYNHFSDILYSYSHSRVNGRTNVGGLAGYNHYGDIIMHCYSTGYVAGMVSQGGLIGYNHKVKGSLFGHPLNCFWDVTTSGISTSDGGIGLTTKLLHDKQTFLNADWDFIVETDNGIRNVWEMSFESGYPIHSIPDEPNGLGTVQTPYILETPEQLGAMWYRPLSSYTLNTSINLSCIQWRMGIVPCFGGEIIGDGHLIEGLDIAGGGFLGFIGMLLRDASVSSVGLQDVFIAHKENQCGGLVAHNGGTVTRCYTNGKILGDNWNYYTGGLIGYNTAHGVVKDCYSTISITAKNHVGGLVGHNANGVIKNCYSTGVIDANGWNVAGLVGCDWDKRALDCFWNIETSGESTSYGGIGLLTDAMQDVQTYQDVGWDFVGETTNGVEDIWRISPNDYPQLACFRDFGFSVIESLEVTGDNGSILSVNGVRRLYVGITSFANASFWPNHPPEAADDLDLSTIAICDGQQSVQTNFNESMDAVLILIRGNPGTGYIQRLNRDGEESGSTIQFEPTDFNLTGFASLGRPVYGALLSGDDPFYGVNISGVDGSMLDIYLVSIVGIQDD